MKATTLKHMKVLDSYLAVLYKDMAKEPAVCRAGVMTIPADKVDEWVTRLGAETMRIALMLQYEQEDSK